jgi:hypothetical protein
MQIGMDAMKSWWGLMDDNSWFLRSSHQAKDLTPRRRTWFPAPLLYREGSISSSNNKIIIPIMHTNQRIPCPLDYAVNILINLCKATTHF